MNNNNNNNNNNINTTKNGEYQHNVRTTRNEKTNKHIYEIDLPARWNHVRKKVIFF